MSTKPYLVIATGNPGKTAEMKGLFRDTPFILLNLHDFGGIADIAETGSTFEENAILKAIGYARQTATIALADDSGLEIEALGDAPGVLSARYGGDETPFSRKMAMLLDELAKTNDADRSARFVCSIAVADRSGKILVTSRGACEGRIASGPRGSNGFGYDPIFIPTGYHMTFGELPDGIKHKISHRALASQTIIRYLLDFMAV